MRQSTALLGEPRLVDADHFSHSRNQAAHWAASYLDADFSLMIYIA